jgi:IS30 family transposase
LGCLSVRHTASLWITGKEFAGHETVNSVPGIPTYLAHPDSSWERGLNENTNGLTREYLKKGDSPKGLTLEQCSRIEDKWNAHPRNALNFAAPAELYHKLADRSI